MSLPDMTPPPQPSSPPPSYDVLHRSSVEAPAPTTAAGAAAILTSVIVCLACTLHRRAKTDGGEGTLTERLSKSKISVEPDHKLVWIRA